MNVRQIISLFRSSAEPGAKASANCLPPERLAAYQDAKLTKGEWANAQAHLAICDACLGQLAAISRAAAARESEAGVPPFMIARAAALFTPPTPVRAPTRWRWAVPLAAAAALLLALNLALISSSGPNREPGGTSTPVTRIASDELPLPRLLVPAEGSLVRPPEQVFRWTVVPGALFYDVHLLNLDGDLLLRERIDETQWLIPESLRLEPGKEYFVRVDAYLDDAKYLSSQHRLFRVEGMQ